MSTETIQDVIGQRNWLANRLSYMMNGPLAGTPSDMMVGWDTGPITRPSPEQVVLMAREMVEHGDNGYTYKTQTRHKPLPTTTRGVNDINMPGSIHFPGPSFPSPTTSLYESMDQGAFTGERQSAKELSELVSDSGAPYQEETREDRSSWSNMPRTARTGYDPLEGLSMRFNNYPEIAYWCPAEELWVQGAPSAVEYNDIGMLSGSSGHKLVCRSCGHQIGALVEKRS